MLTLRWFAGAGDGRKTKLGQFSPELGLGWSREVAVADEGGSARLAVSNKEQGRRRWRSRGHNHEGLGWGLKSDNVEGRGGRGSAAGLEMRLDLDPDRAWKLVAADRATRAQCWPG